MRRTAAVGLGFAGLFLTIVAVLVGAPGLFYMSTAVLATLLASRLQAWYAIQKLKVSRSVPPSVTAGDAVTVEYFVTGGRRTRLPLILLEDSLPKRMHPQNVSRSLPVAPSSKGPVRSQYTFIPTQRGRYRWSGVIVHGMDAMGLSHVTKAYSTATSDLLVLPKPIPMSYELPRGGGFGTFEEGQSLVHSGIDSRGIRGYRMGDPLRHVHWRSTARVGSLQVKEFEGGSISYAGLIVQLDLGTNLEFEGSRSLDLMAGNIAFMAEDMARKGCYCFFPTHEDLSAISSKPERQIEILEYLADLDVSRNSNLVAEVSQAVGKYADACSYYIFASVLNQQIVDAIMFALKKKVHIYLIWYGQKNWSGQPKLTFQDHRQSSQQENTNNGNWFSKFAVWAQNLGSEDDTKAVATAEDGLNLSVLRLSEAGVRVIDPYGGGIVL